ncbi:MAG: hypothetical protein WEC75_04360 [Dehalococcoidia bacterium]
MAQDDLTQDFEAHLRFTFAHVPEEPALANRVARTKRWFTIAFAESWLAAFLYRAKVRLRGRGVAALPGLCDLLARGIFRVHIGDEVEIGPGLMVTHGNVVIDGRTKIGRNCQISPWVTIGLSNSRKLGFSADGPTIGDEVHIGTGAKILGPVTVGDHARIGANAVVVSDVPPNVTVVGAPARVVGPKVATNGTSAGNGSDEPIVHRMRSAIVDYKLRRQSLRTLIDTLMQAFEGGSDRLRVTQNTLRDDLIFLDAVAATGGEETQQVQAAIDSVDATLREFFVAT